MGDDDEMMLTAYQRAAVEFFRRTEEAEAQADELRALLPEAPTLLAEPAPPRFNPDLAAEGARLVEAAAGPGTRAAVAHWMEQDARRQQQAHRALRIVEALLRASVFRPCETAFRADWDSEEDARFVFDALREMAL